MKEIIPSFIITSTDPEITFQKFGLRSRGLLRGESVEPRYSSLSPPALFRGALEELGGLYAAFGQFLCWRADLLGADYLRSLRGIRVPAPPLPPSDVAAVLRAELGASGDALAERLEPEPCWNNLARCAYRTRYQERTIVAQVARELISDAAFDTFEAGVRLIEDEKIREAIQPASLARFREWMRLSDSPERERGYLEALKSIKENTLAEYPALIPELSSNRLLCLEWVDGEPLGSHIGSPEAVRRVAECVLEQCCTVAALDGDFDPDSMALTSSGRLVLRHTSRMAPIPAAMTHTGLKYISAVLASNAPAAAHMLAMLCGGVGTNLEARLLDELSNLEPELKVNLQYPPSAAIFEGNWRALARTGAAKPLFLDLLHRNLIGVGYWNSETSAPPGQTPVHPAPDFLAEAQWPVLNRMLRTRLGDMGTRETASDWLIGSGLLVFESLRQVNRLAEGLRENDFSLGVDLQRDDDAGKSHQRIRLGILVGILLIVFLGCLRFAVSTGGAWSAVLSAIAAATGFALFWFVSRFD